MDFLHAIIFGIVEGITEFLPISSTGHLMLTAQVMGLGQTEFLKTFEIAIQLGAILSVVVLYWRSLFVDREIAKRVLAAFLPTAVLGLLFYKIIKKYLLAGTGVVLWSLFIGGIFLIIFEILHRRRVEPFDELSSIPYSTALVIGVFQSIAMIPGVSRAAATIVGGLLLGVRRKTIVEFSFLLAVPTMLAATCLDLYKNAGSFSMAQLGSLAVGFVVSFVAALLAVKFLLNFIKHHTFIPFGIYRVAVALFFWVFLVLK
ncbi:MAG TPA: undecaprenyl-diphosphate phosphatase [Syntrophorhabdales bacterium]|nr:undecaprenyl-diphosphate phosphatase [Syntrophorhabdales bacterium]